MKKIFNINYSHTALLLAIYALFFVFLILPLGDVFQKSFWVNGHFTLEFFRLMVDNPLMQRSIINSFILGLVVVIFTALLTLPLSVVMTRFEFRFKGLMQGLLLVPLIMPPFVGAIGIKQLFARFGSINLLLMKLGIIEMPIDWLGSSGFWGVVFLEVIHLYPIMYLNMVAAMANIDPTLEEAAFNLSARFPTVLRRIILPLIIPGFFAGATITFIWAFTDLGTPVILNFKETIPVQIFNLVTDIHQNQMGYALVVFMAVVTTVMFLLSKKVIGTKRYEMLSRGHITSRERRVPWWAQILILGSLLGLVTIALLPHLGVVMASFSENWFGTILPEHLTTRYYEQIGSNPMAYVSIKNSFFYSICSVILDIILGITIAYLLTRTRIRTKGLLDSLSMLPLALPGLVLAFGYVSTFSGTWIDPRHNPTLLLIISYSFRRMPYMVRAAYAGFQQSSVYLEEAARNLGASVLTTIRRITVPLIYANLIAGSMICFAYAMLEVSDSLILAMKEQYFPITKAIYMLFSYVSDGISIACVLGVIGMVILSASLIIAGRFLGQKLGELFRTG